MWGKIGLDSSHTKAPYMIITPSGKIASNQILRCVPIQLGSKMIKTDLISLSLEGMDVVLGMDWTTKHKVLLDSLPKLLRLIHHIKEPLPFIFCNKSTSLLVLLP